MLTSNLAGASVIHLNYRLLANAFKTGTYIPYAEKARQYYLFLGRRGLIMNPAEACVSSSWRNNIFPKVLLRDLKLLYELQTMYPSYDLTSPSEADAGNMSISYERC